MLKHSSRPQTSGEYPADEQFTHSGNTFLPSSSPLRSSTSTFYCTSACYVKGTVIYRTALRLHLEFKENYKRGGLQPKLAVRQTITALYPCQNLLSYPRLRGQFSILQYIGLNTIVETEYSIYFIWYIILVGFVQSITTYEGELVIGTEEHMGRKPMVKGGHSAAALSLGSISMSKRRNMFE